MMLLAAMSMPAVPQTAAEPRPTFQISGRVVDAVSGEALAGARVGLAVAARRDPPISVVTGADGRFLFSSLPAGKYVLMAQRRGYRLQTYSQHGSYSVGIVAGPGLDSRNLVFRLTPDAAIAGRIVDEEGDPVENAQVRLFREQAPEGVRTVEMVAQAGSDADGYFHFGHLEEGRYLLAVAARPWYAVPISVDPSAAPDGSTAALDKAYPTTFYANATEPERAEAIVLQPGERVRADLVMRAVPAVHLRLPPAAASDQSLSVAQPVFGELESVAGNTTVASDGSLEVSGIAPGRYIISEGGASLTLGVTGDAQIGPETFTPGTSLSGIVDLGNQPRPPTLSVVLVNRESHETVEAEVHKDGRFEQTAALPAGVYEVSFGPGLDLQVGSMAASGAQVRGHTLRVNGGEAVHLAVVAAQGTGRVEGVAQRDGRPVAGAMIVLVPADAENDRVLFRRDQSDSDGSFTLANAVPGKYTVIAIADGWELEWARPALLVRYLRQGVPVQVTANQAARVQVTVQPQ